MGKAYKYYIQSGICPSCKSKPRLPSVVLCKPCYDRRNSPERKKKQRELAISYKAKNRSLGLCDRCKNQRVEGKNECQQCIDKTMEARAKRRQDVFNLYGAKCACCGEDRWEFLTIDHIHGKGNKERQSGFKVYHLRSKLLKEGKPNPDYQVLCMNCNFAKGIHGYCPHRKYKYD